MPARLGTIALAVLAPVALLALAEAGCWLAGVTSLDADPAHRLLRTVRRNHFDPSDDLPRCALETDPDDRRRHVVALGGSSVKGVPVGERSAFPARLGAMLEAEQPGRWRVDNLGFSAKDSTFVLECGRVALAAHPRWLVVYSGHNDFANWGVHEPRLRILLEDHFWIQELDWWLARSRFYSWAVRTLRPPPAELEEGRPPPPPAALERASAVVVARFEANLTRLVELAAEAGAGVVLVTVASNLHEHPLVRAEWGDELARRREEPGLGPWGEHFQRGVDLHRAGEFEAARVEFARARDLDPRGRARSELNERVRAIAARYDHVEVVDFEGELARRSGAAGVGCNFFGDDRYCDQFHPNRAAHRILARLLARRLLASAVDARLSP